MNILQVKLYTTTAKKKRLKDYLLNMINMKTLVMKGGNRQCTHTEINGHTNGIPNYVLSNKS